MTVPLRTENIPCATCGVPRPVTDNRPSRFIAAAKRSCRTCTLRGRATFGDRRVEHIPCAKCKVPRPIVIDSQADARRAERRMCRACQAQGKLEPWHGPTYADWVVVDRLMQGKQVRSNSAERRAAVQALTEQGLSAKQIAARIHIAHRSVTRIRDSIRKGMIPLAA